jgi:hypothetical protein
VKRGTFPGAIRLFDAALEKLDPFPDGYGDVDRSAAVEAARRHRMRIAGGQMIDVREYAKLTMVRA